MKLKINIDQKAYEVEVEPVEADAPTAPPREAGGERRPPAPQAQAQAAPAAPPAAAVNEDKVCRSPVSGIVVRVAVQPGQTLQVGDVLIVLEAMKMETNITAPFAGKVAAIRAQQGDGVQSGQVVVEFE